LIFLTTTPFEIKLDNDRADGGTGKGNPEIGEQK
jgi:hypothetical protein